MSMLDAWPQLSAAEWAPTRETLHLWTQIVGKIRMARTPLSNHWWNVVLYVSARGLTTSLIPAGVGRGFEMEFDFVAHTLEIRSADGGRRAIALAPRSVADFHAEVMTRLEELGLTTEIWPMPVEIEGAIPFPDDHDHASYDAEQVERFFRILVSSDRVMRAFQGGFVGKASPVHFFWGGFDLATTRFSGRRAPDYERPVPHCGPHVMREACSHEVSSCGYWPSSAGEGCFYAYAYPEPAGYAEAFVDAGVVYDDALGEYVLAYEQLRRASDPDAAVLEFFTSTYTAAADLAHWDRSALERR